MDKEFDQLIIFSSDKDFNLSDSYSDSYLYSIGPGNLNCRDLCVINDPIELNKIAEGIRDQFSEWIYEQNQIFLKNNLIHRNDLSMFFLTDFSCKRSEFFDTYNSVCNLIQIQKKINVDGIKSVVFIGVSEAFVQTASKIFENSTFEYIDIKKNKETFFRGFIKNSIYFTNMMIFCLFNLFFKSSSRNYRRLYLTRYPLHFIDDDNLEDKYGEIDLKKDNFLVSIATDGFHQKVSPLEYLKYLNQCLSKGFSILDLQVRLSDIIVAFWEYLKLIPKWKNLSKKDYVFQQYNISAFCRNELIFSLNRVVRLLLWDKPIRRFFTRNDFKEFYYYLHEYPYGRLFTYILKSYPRIKTTAMQSGPASFRKMLYFLSRGEIGNDDNYLQHVPAPEKILAEDSHSGMIYSHAGYHNIEIMENISRLKYLEDITPGKPCYILICPGLHDGELMINSLREEIINNPNKQYLIKPHPRGSKGYLRNNNFDNLEVSNIHIAKLLTEAEKVIVTYSSVGMEAKYLGIPTEVINVPGIISESPLLDDYYQE